MKYRFKKLLPYLLTYAASFYGLTIFASFDRISPAFTYAFVHIILCTIVVLGASMVYAVKHGFRWGFVLVAPVVFLPVCFVYPDGFGFAYLPLYLLAGLLGLGLGFLLRLPGERKRRALPKE